MFPFWTALFAKAVVMFYFCYGQQQTLEAMLAAGPHQEPGAAVRLPPAVAAGQVARVQEQQKGAALRSTP